MTADEPAAPTAPGAPPRRRGGGAASVAAGIFSSRVFGFLRDRAIAHYFGVGPHADVFRTALRGPNILQNLLGEGTISASFIPVYTRLLSQGRREEAGRFAGAIFGLLLAAAGSFALLGVLLARPLVALLVPGFLRDAATGAAVDRYELAVSAVRTIFPMTAVLVLSAWALGVLNSHRRFFLPYFAPVLWNAAIIAALWWVGRGSVGVSAAGPDRILQAACVGALAGGLLQFGVQIPAVARELRGFKLSFSTRVQGVGEALRAFGPVVASRGVVQLTGYLDSFLASFLAIGAVSGFAYAYTLYILPVSLFAMSVAAAELPELSAAGAVESPASNADLLVRVDDGLRRMAFLNVPACVGYLLFGYPIVGALYRTGRFGEADNWLTTIVLAALATGLVATTSSRLLQNLFYALRDTATPSRVAVLRVVFSGVLGVPAMLALDRISVGALTGLPGAGGELRLGAAGLGLGAGIAAWVELSQLRRRLRLRLPDFRLPWAAILRMGLAAGLAAVPAAAVWYASRDARPWVTAGLLLTAYGIGYLAAAYSLGVPEAGSWLRRLARIARPAAGSGEL